MRTMLFGAVACAALLAAGPLGAQQFTLKYAHVGPATENSDDHVPGVFLKSFLESRSGGRIKVEIYPAGQLGQFRELFEQIQLNTLELTHTSVGGASAFFPEIQVTDIPYMIRDDLVAEAVGRGPFFEKLRDAVLKKTGNVRLVAMGNTGRWRSFFTKKPVLKAADLAGMKIRIVDRPIQVNFVRGAGANPVPIPWGEVYTSLATGVAEGLNIAITDVVPNKLHEVVKHVVIDEHMYLYGFYWMSDAWLKSLPKDLQTGIRQMGNYYKEGTRVYLLGEIYPHGHWSYYLVCLALKPPIAFQILLGLGLAALLGGVWRRRLPPDRLFVLVPGLIYLVFSMTSPIQLGIRLILPAIGFFVLVAGFGIEWLRRRRQGKPVLAALVAFLAVSTGRVFPHDISYFNEWAGGPERGWRYLSDSNVDWGHCLPELASYMKRHGIEKLKMFPFGFDKPHRYFPRGEAELEFTPWTPDKIRGAVYEPQPAIYAVPVSLLGGQYYEPEFKDYLRFFRDRPPDARPGFCTFVYDLTEKPST